MRSVAMAAFQGMPYIRLQMLSILAQLSPDDEVVVSDNGSTDGTLAFLEDLAKSDLRIRIFTLPEPKGVIPNFQNAIAKCRGSLIFLSDQDDIWMDNKLDVMSRIFEENPGIIAVQADAELIDANDRTTDPSFFALCSSGPGFWKNFRKNTWQGCNMAFRRGILELALPFPRSIPMHDMWIGLLSELAGEVKFLPVVLARYRRHGDNASAMSRARWRDVIKWRFCLAWSILRKLPQLGRFKQTFKMTGTLLK